MSKVYKYDSYEDYVEWQTKTNKSKLKWVFASQVVINKLCDLKPGAKNILCHGTRNGAEQRWFSERFPNAYVIGSEISETATQFDMTVQHDFMEPKKEWVGKFDIVYSNSYDHTIRPKETLQVWKDQLVKGGHLFLEYSAAQSECTPQDPLKAKTREVIQWMREVGFSDVKVLPDVCGKNRSETIQGVSK